MSEDLRGLISYIYSIESRGGDYNIVHTGIPKNLRPAKPLTEMTVGEVLAWQDEIDPFVNSEAAGAMQIMPDTLRSLIDEGKVDPSAMFDADTQDGITVSLMERRGLRKWQAGEISTGEFGNQLAMEWAGLPLLEATYKGDKLLERGNAYYGGDGMNPDYGLTAPEVLEAVLADPSVYDAEKWRASISTSGGGTWEPGVGITRQGVSRGVAGQFGDRGPGSSLEYPWKGQVLLDTARRNQLALPGAGGGIPDMPALPSANYGTRTGEGGGADLGATWSRVFADEWADSFLVQGTRDWWATRNTTYDMEFDPVTAAVDEGRYSQDEILFLGAAENRMDYDRLKRQIDSQRARDYRREVYDGWVAPLMGGMLNPDSLVSMIAPGGVIVSGMRRAGVNAAKSAVAGALMSGASEAALEAGRSRYDSQANGMDSLIRVGMATALGGVFSAAVAGAVTPAARRGLAERAATELAHARGVGKTSATIDIGRGQKATVVLDGDDMIAVSPEGMVPRGRVARVVDVDGRPVLAVIDGEDAARGVFRIRDRIIVNAKRLAERVKAGDVPEGVTTANELMEYEIGRAGAFARKIREFFKREDGGVGPGPREDDTPFVQTDEAGNVTVDRARLQQAMNEAGIVRLGDGVQRPNITPIEVEAVAFDSVEQLEAAVRQAHEFAKKARDEGEFRDMVSTIFGGKLDEMEPEEVLRARAAAKAEAEAEAADHLRAWRKENNKILQDARVEAFARIMDSPYKRIHRNALHSYTRDVVDLLAADGGFLRGADGKGQNLGPSVYSRAKTWLGMVDRLYRKERELYAKYLGMETNPGVLGVNLSDFKRKRMDGSKAIPMREWRRMVTRTHITRVPSDIPEVNEMATHLKGVLDEYGIVADEYGVITGMKTMQRRHKKLSDMIDMTRDDAKRAAMEADLKQLEDMMAQAAEEPGEDYFSRVWSRKAILANREAFKERIVKPWMMQQPYVWEWKPGKDELRRALADLRDTGADAERIAAMEKRIEQADERGGYKRIETSGDMADLDQRAERLVQTLLDEADPSDLSTLREAHRPTFGRHRQFNIPNRMLLKDGPEGNGIADFIETDYLLVQRVYADRMGPAIEMARTFGRPADGVSGLDGWENALKQAQEAEKTGWIRKLLGGDWNEDVEWARGTAAADEKGQPITLYHGTRNDFDQFKASSTDGKSGPKASSKDSAEGIFFAESPSISEQYALWIKSDKGVVKSVLGLEKPIIKKAFIKVKNPMIIDGTDKAWNETMYMDWIKEAKSKGHDAIKIENIADNVGGKARAGNIWIVFDPGNARIIGKNEGAGNFGVKEDTDFLVKWRNENFKEVPDIDAWVKLAEKYSDIPRKQRKDPVGDKNYTYWVSWWDEKFVEEYPDLARAAVARMSDDFKKARKFDEISEKQQMAWAVSWESPGSDVIDGLAAAKKIDDANAKNWSYHVEKARRRAYDDRLAEINAAPARLEAAEEELERAGAGFARAKERAELAGMSDEQADEWLDKAEERGRAAWKRKTVGTEQSEALARAEEDFVASVVKQARITFKEVRLDEGGKAKAADGLARAELDMAQVRGRRNYFLRMVNMTEDEALSDAAEEAANVDPQAVIEAAGGPKFADHWAPIERDLLHLRDRVSNRVIRNPERWDNRAATALKDYSRLTFMGLAGLNALQEFGMMVNRHGASKAFRAAFMNVDADMAGAMKAGVLEMQKAGAILDVAMGGALASFAETGMDATFGTTAERWLRAASNRFFNWNGLAPITARFKEMDAMIRVHDTVEKINNVYLGVASQAEIEDLSRFGISVDTAKRMGREPIQQTEGGHWLANTDQWGDEDLVRTFRAAIAQGNENTILMATAADKPIIVDGTAYIRKGGAVDGYAKKLGLREVGDYWQVQSGLMSLPFSFWNYGIAATNKILISGIDEPSGQKLAGIGVMIGLGYMIAQLRTDPGQWEGLSVSDRVAKAVDQSGVTGLIGTYANLFQGASIATMGVNPLPFERTRGIRQPSMMDMAEQFAGAGPSAVANLIRGVAGGDLAEARWGLPLANYIGTGWMWDALIDGLNRKQAGLD